MVGRALSGDLRPRQPRSTRLLRWAALLSLIGGLLAACAAPQPPAADAARAALAAFVREQGGGDYEVSFLQLPESGGGACILIEPPLAGQNAFVLLDSGGEPAAWAVQPRPQVKELWAFLGCDRAESIVLAEEAAAAPAAEPAPTVAPTPAPAIVLPPPLDSPRRRHAVAALPDGRLLIIAGVGPDGPRSDTLIYDPEGGGWAPGAALPTPLDYPVAAPMGDGRLLVIGLSARSVASAIYDPEADAWSEAPSPPEPLPAMSLVALADGRVLRTGGFVAEAFGGSAQAAIFDPQTERWSAVEPMGSARHDHSATLLPDGRVLVYGGRHSSLNGTEITLTDVGEVELFDPASERWTAARPRLGSDAQARHAATLLPGGELLMAGGVAGSFGANNRQVWRYDPAQDSWARAADLPLELTEHPTATLLPDGRVLLVGGGAAIYDPATDSWATPGPEAEALLGGRTAHSASLLPDGQVLIVGGDSDGQPLSSAVLVDADLGARARPSAAGCAPSVQAMLDSRAQQFVGEEQPAAFAALDEFLYAFVFVGGKEEGYRYELADRIGPLQEGADFWVVRVSETRSFLVDTIVVDTRRTPELTMRIADGRPDVLMQGVYLSACSTKEDLAEVVFKLSSGESPFEPSPPDVTERWREVGLWLAAR